MAFAARAFSLVAIRDHATRAALPARDRDESDAGVQRFLAGFRGLVEFAGKRVLDLGCGDGGVCIEAASRGATHVVGIDWSVDAAGERVAERAAEFSHRIELIRSDGTLDALAGREFDVVMSRDRFEHYSDPERVMRLILPLLAPGGSLYVGFGPLWKSPGGGHLAHLTRMPWAHLVFPERVITQERMRLAPDEEADTSGVPRDALNKMTYERFRRIVDDSGLACAYFATNVSGDRGVRALDVASRIPGMREYFTQNAYAILRKLDDDVAA
jgi:SAM-dependent methyltransferase